MKGDFGARLIAPGQTRFRLWAPDANSVAVRVTGGAETPMQRDADGVFVATVPVGAGTCYRYVLPGGKTVPDPASHGQAGDVDDDSIVIDHAYAWKYPDWHGRPWEQTVLYELHVGVAGGFAGALAQLPRLAQLGITAIELMPVAEFPGNRSWGYDGVLPYAPDAAYGSPDELKALVDAAHGLGLMMFLDVVYNHFGPAGNYLNEYAKSFFRDDIQTPWGSAIDFRRPQVRRFYIENALYWLKDFRFDGLRFDAVSMIKDDGFLAEMAAELKQTLAAARHVHLVMENENNEAALLKTNANEPKFDGQWTDDWHHCLHVLLTGEHEGYYGDFPNPAEQLARCMGEGFAYQGEPSAHAGGAPRGTKSAHLPPSSFVICLQNHDQIGNRAFGERLTTLATPAALRAATLLLLLTPQIPLVFMGDEWAETKPFLFFTDHHDELADKVREGRRKEFEFFSAFTDPAKRKQIPDPNALETFIAATPQMPEVLTADQAAMQALYTQALKLRAAEIAPRLRGAVSVGAHALGNTGIRAAWRLGDGAVLTLAANLGNTSLACPPGAGEMSCGTGGVFEIATLPACTTCAWLQHP